MALLDGRDIDGAYLGRPLYDAYWERHQQVLWEREHGEPWTIDGADLMEAELPIGERTTNHGPGPAWGDLVRVGHFEVRR